LSLFSVSQCLRASVLPPAPAHQSAPSSQKLQNEPTASPRLGVWAARPPGPPLKMRRTNPCAILSHIGPPPKLWARPAKAIMPFEGACDEPRQRRQRRPRKEETQRQAE